MGKYSDCTPGLVKFVPSVARLFCLALPGSFLTTCFAHNFVHLKEIQFTLYNFRRYESESSEFLSFVPLSFSWDQRLYDRDGLHLNVAGYVRLGEDVAAAVKKYVPKARM